MKVIQREEMQERLDRARAVTEDPAAVLCIEPFAAVERDGGAHLGTLLSRVMADPKRALLVTTEDAFVFAFGDQRGPEGQHFIAFSCGGGSVALRFRHDLRQASHAGFDVHHHDQFAVA